MKLENVFVFGVCHKNCSNHLMECVINSTVGDMKVARLSLSRDGLKHVL